MAPYKLVQVAPLLADIGKVTKVPFNGEEICALRTIYPLMESYDAGTFILWYQGHFKVTDLFPWGNVRQNLLSTSLVGKSIAIIPQEYDHVHAIEFELVNPEDAVQETYAISASMRRDPNQRFLKRDLVNLNAGLMNQNLTQTQASRHPVWFSLFHNSQQELSDFVDWVWDKNIFEGDVAMGIYIKKPEKSSAIMLKYGGMSSKFALFATKGFEEEKVFLVLNI